MLRINNPVPIFLDRNGMLLDDGNIYIGTPNLDPETNPVAVFWDPGLTIPASQPIKTLGGVLVNGATPAFVYTAASDYSIKISDALNVQINYAPSIQSDLTSYQPLDADLTAIAALATTTFGRNLLTLANQAALVSAVGLPDALPKAGGTMTGDITRQGNGVYVYWSPSGLTSGRMFLTASAAADPTSLPGDIWLTY